MPCQPVWQPRITNARTLCARGRPRGSYKPENMCQHQILRSKCQECRIDRCASRCEPRFCARPLFCALATPCGIVPAPDPCRAAAHNPVRRAHHRRLALCPHKRPLRNCKECGMRPPTNWKICQHNRHKTDCIECCMLCFRLYYIYICIYMNAVCFVFGLRFSWFSLRARTRPCPHHARAPSLSLCG